MSDVTCTHGHSMIVPFVTRGVGNYGRRWLSKSGLLDRLVMLDCSANGLLLEAIIFHLAFLLGNDVSSDFFLSFHTALVKLLVMKKS